MSTDDRRARVLIVEDEPDLAALYRDWLRPTYSVETVHSGEAALDQMVEMPPDVVLLDRHLPDISGDTVLTSARDRGHEQPVAMVTAVTPDFDALDLGFDEYLSKPVDREELHDTVEHLLDARSWVALQRSLSAKKIKRNVLQLEHSDLDLAENDEYSRLIDEINRLESRLARRKERTDTRVAE